jgi:3-oxoacyl-[acyl-carrier-protein] synthase-3
LKLAGLERLRLAGSAVALPDTADLSNGDVFKRLLGVDHAARLAERGWDEEHPRVAWGVEHRRWCAPGTSGASEELAERAARGAMEDAGVSAGSVDLFVTATSTPGRVTSSMASAVAKRLGLEAACVDLRAGGTGGLQAWITAASLLACGAQRALVVAAETPSRYLDPEDLSSALLYGDGAGALLIERVEGESCGLVGALVGARGAQGRPFTVPGELPPRAADVEAGAFRFQVPDADYLRELADAWRATCTDLRASFPEELAQARHFLPYAVTRAQLEQAAEVAGKDAAHAGASLAAHGCTGAAGPLIALHELRAAGELAAGDILASSAVAGGLSCCSLLWRV